MGAIQISKPIMTQVTKRYFTKWRILDEWNINIISVSYKNEIHRPTGIRFLVKHLHCVSDFSWLHIWNFETVFSKIWLQEIELLSVAVQNMRKLQHLEVKYNITVVSLTIKDLICWSDSCKNLLCWSVQSSSTGRVTKAQMQKSETNFLLFSHALSSI